MKKFIKFLGLSVFSLSLLTSCKMIGNLINGDPENNNENNNNEEDEKLEKIDVYKIEDLALLSDNPDADVELHNDLDFRYQSFSLNIEYNGVFNGNGYSIKNINNTSISESKFEMFDDFTFYSSIFKGIGLDAQIKDVVFENVACDLSYEKGFSKSGSVSLLSAYNYGLISNCKFSECSVGLANSREITLAKAYTSIVTGHNMTSGKIENCTLNDCRLSIEGDFFGEEDFSNVWVGMVTGVNDGEITSTIINNPAYFSYSVGGVAYYNKGKINNTAIINGSFYSESSGESFGADKYIGGICAINGGEVENNYLFNASINVETIIEFSQGNYLVHPGLVGGLVGNNINDALLTNCYFEGRIESTPTYELLEKYGSHFVTAEKVDFGSFALSGICARNIVNLYSNFSDCLISGGASGSLTCGIENTNLHQDIFSFYLRYQESEIRLNTQVKKYANESFQEALYSEADKTLKYYFSENNSYTDGKTTWEEFLNMKGFMNNSFKLGQFYPILSSNIGYEGEGAILQSLVMSSPAKRKTL